LGRDNRNPLRQEPPHAKLATLPLAGSFNISIQTLGRTDPFFEDGRICLSNNAAERAVRRIAIGRKAWLFAGSDCGGERAAAMYTLIETANSRPSTHRLGSPTCSPRIADHPARQPRQLLPWNWRTTTTQPPPNTKRRSAVAPAVLRARR
jgi:hypothetical protein